MDDQQMFDRNINVFWSIIKWLFKAIIYIPLFFTAFIIVSAIMKKEVSTLLGLAVIIFVTFVLYLFVYFMKGMLICLKMRRNGWWVVLFIICVAFTCILPIYVITNPVTYLVNSLGKPREQHNVLTWIFSLSFGVYVYFRYDFLTNIAPRIAFPAYQIGINAAGAILHLTSLIKPVKSDDAI